MHCCMVYIVCVYDSIKLSLPADFLRVGSDCAHYVLWVLLPATGISFRNLFKETCVYIMAKKLAVYGLSLILKITS